jgi:glycosyltransferase involved in cell wall biosynthesis
MPGINARVSVMGAAKCVRLKIKMSKLSVTVITKNEQANVGDCFASVAFAHERVILDAGSTDRTLEIARSLGVVLMQSTDWPGFGPQKNRALTAATGDWILSIDADERVSSALADEIRKVMQEADAQGQKVAFEIPRVTQFCGVWIRHCGWTPDYVLRLFKRGEARFSDDLVHEKLLLIDPQTKIIRLKTQLLHYSYPSPAHYWRKLQQYSQDWAKQKHQEGRKVSIFRALVSGVAAFVRSYIFRLGFLDGAMGLAVCTMQAQAAFGKYFELYYLNQQDAKRTQSF